MEEINRCQLKSRFQLVQFVVIRYWWSRVTKVHSHRPNQFIERSLERQIIIARLSMNQFRVQYLVLLLASVLQVQLADILYHILIWLSDCREGEQSAEPCLTTDCGQTGQTNIVESDKQLQLVLELLVQKLQTNDIFISELYQYYWSVSSLGNNRIFRPWERLIVGSVLVLHRQHQWYRL